MFLTAILDYAEKMIFAHLDFSTFLICCSGDLSDNESDEKRSVAICGGSICILTGLDSCLHHHTVPTFQSFETISTPLWVII